MTQRVINDFEIVQIKHQHRGGDRMTPEQLEVPFKLVLQLSTVVESSQLIGITHLSKLHLQRMTL
jgi:hypothetical protein